jgi:hypothetical protein
MALNVRAKELEARRTATERQVFADFEKRVKISDVQTREGPTYGF